MWDRRAVRTPSLICVATRCGLLVIKYLSGISSMVVVGGLMRVLLNYPLKKRQFSIIFCSFLVLNIYFEFSSQAQN